MATRLLDDPDALTLILQQLRVENDLTTSLRRLRNFSAVNQYARDHLVVHYEEIAHALLSVDMGMSPSDLATMIRQMTLAHRANLVTLAEQWNTPYAIEDEYFSGCAALALPTLSSDLTSIGEEAFAHCTALDVVQWDASRLTTVGYSAFVGCVNLTLRTWQSPELTTVSESVFDNCVTLTLERWYAPKLDDMWSQVFEGRDTLVLSTWDSTALDVIRMRTFKGCARLTLVNWIAPALWQIMQEAFSGCSALVWENGCPFPLAPMNIEDGAFYGCTGLSLLARSQIEAINPDAFINVAPPV